MGRKTMNGKPRFSEITSGITTGQKKGRWWQAVDWCSPLQLKEAKVLLPKVKEVPVSIDERKMGPTGPSPDRFLRRLGTIGRII